MKIEINPTTMPAYKRIGFFIEISNKNEDGRLWFIQFWFFWVFIFIYGKRVERILDGE